MNAKSPAQSMIAATTTSSPSSIPLTRSLVSTLSVTPLTPSTSLAIAVAQAFTSSPAGAFASADLYSGTAPSCSEQVSG